jgi:hypothetical protein
MKPASNEVVRVEMRTHRRSGEVKYVTSVDDRVICHGTRNPFACTAGRLIADGYDPAMTIAFVVDASIGEEQAMSLQEAFNWTVSNSTATVLPFRRPR